MKRMDLTILVEKGEDGFYVGQIQEYPPVMSQGKTLDELKENLKDALTLFLEVQKEQVEKDYSKRKIVKRRLIFSQ
ncbi:MAG TPA: type II toxin-antitoxin system HicB family antitoxin [Prolixibacteraceae bacterium]|jgi:predicted RNase H-like HicB family nuclease|nr:type II toxin-antitoxin system HicB family antitoxin [Prolixibacteraceae bacterium]